MLKVFHFTTKLVKEATMLRASANTFKESCASAGPDLTLLQSLIWIQLMEIRDGSACMSTGQSMVQIDTDLLLLEHICQTQTSPGERDRCWWSSVFPVACSDSVGPNLGLIIK